MTVPDAVIEEKILKDFYKKVGKEAVNIGTKLVNYQVRALEVASNIGTSTATTNPAGASS